MDGQKILSCDQGREFVNVVSHCLSDMTKMEQRISSAYHSQINGLDERTNQTLVKSLTKLTSQVDWDLNIDAALYAYRISRQDSSGYSPFFLLYTRQPRKAIDYQLNDRENDEPNDIPPAQNTDKIISRLIETKQLYHDKAKSNIKKAQDRQKMNYDAKYSQQVRLFVCKSSFIKITY